MCEHLWMNGFALYIRICRDIHRYTGPKHKHYSFIVENILLIEQSISCYSGSKKNHRFALQCSWTDMFSFKWNIILWWYFKEMCRWKGLCVTAQTRSYEWNWFKQSLICSSYYISELRLDSSKLKDRVTVPLPKLTLGLCFSDVGSQSLLLVFKLMDEDGDDEEDPPMLPDLFLAAVLCFSVALAATLNEWAAVLHRTSSMVFLEGLKRMM